jgi:hypothetical protein
LLNENIAGNGLVRPEQEDREQGALLQATEVQCVAVSANLNRS